MSGKHERKHPPVIGLTGSIGMGKSTAAKILRGFGAVVSDADKTVHDLLKRDGRAVKKVARLFPEAVKRGVIDRKILGSLVFHDADKRRQLETFLHPMVEREQRAFIKANRHAPAIVLEVPLLFESGFDRLCDVTLCVSAPAAIQRKRVLGRPGMTSAKFRAIRKAQLPDREKRRRADFVVKTGGEMAETRRALQALWKNFTF